MSPHEPPRRPRSWLLPMVLLAGCGSPSLPWHSQMHQSLPQSWEVAAPIEATWSAVVQLAESRDGARVLVRSDEDHLISWIERMDGQLEFVDRLAARQERRPGQTLPAITVIRAEEAPEGSRLVIRQAYFPDGFIETISHSRGRFESGFVRDLLARLALR